MAERKGFEPSLALTKLRFQRSTFGLSDTSLFLRMVLYHICYNNSMVYMTLFLTALISATLFPLGSEALLLYDINEGYSLCILLFVATFGNSLGSLINYYLGLKGEEYCERRKFLKKESISKYKIFFDKYGGYSLFLSWMPIIGDPLTFMAGILKYDIKKFIPIVICAKFMRYVFLAYLVT